MLKKLFSRLSIFFLGFVLFFCKTDKTNKDRTGGGNPLLILLLGDSLPVMEYGMPYAEYNIDGMVQNSVNSPIEGIEVNFAYEKTYTDAAGLWAFNSQTSYICTPDCIVTLKDVDGAENGGDFADKIVDLNLTQTTDENGSPGALEEHNIISIMEEK